MTVLTKKVGDFDENVMCDDVEEELDFVFYQKGDEVKGEDYFDKVDVYSIYIV